MAVELPNEANREYDAFIPMDVDARVVASKSVRIHRIPFNRNLSTVTSIRFTKRLLKNIDIICCKAFGEKTGITMRDNTIVYPNEMSPVLPGATVNPDFEPELLLLCTNDATPIVILMSIIVFCKSEQNDNVIDITTVAKNPKINYKNAFETFLKKIQTIQDEEYSNAYIFALDVKKANTVQMTEQGRLRLYTSLGFLIPAKTPVEMIYPPIQTYVVTHDSESPGRLVLYRTKTNPEMNTESEIDYAVFLGNIKSTGENYIPMIATRDTLGVKRDIYLGTESCFKGDAILLWDENVQGGMSIMPTDSLKKNASVPIEPLEEGDSGIFIQSLYHMSLEKKPMEGAPSNNYIDTFEVPKDFVILSFASPGSVFSVRSPHDITTFTSNLTKLLADNKTMNKFIKLNRSTGILPIYNIQDNSSLTSIFTSNDRGKQLASTLMNSIITDSLGRQPIYEFMYSSADKYKKYQLDVQVYTEGMYMYNNTLVRQTNTDKFTGGRMAQNSQAAAIDDYVGIMGTFNLVDNSQLDDSQYVNKADNTEDTLEGYLQYIKTVAPLPQAENGKKAKYVIFLFGCSAIGTNENYETFYELSHRRSIVHRFTENDTITSDAFLNDILHDKYTNPYEKLCDELARRRTRRRTRGRSRPNRTRAAHNKLMDVYRSRYRNTIKFALNTLRKSKKKKGGLHPKLSRTQG